MAIFNIYLDFNKDYVNLIKDIYKVLTILIVFQFLIYSSVSQKNIINTALTGFIMNDEFMTLLIFVIISLCSYYLVFDKILNFY
jgi:hypothetical protein